MSKENLTKFIEIAAKDPALQARLGQDKVSDQAGVTAFLTKAVAEGKALGLEFTAEECGAWMKAEGEQQAKGELSDAQLDAVAGGMNALNGHLGFISSTF